MLLLAACRAAPGGPGPDPADVVCVPGAEVCNGIDDDCDGRIDQAASGALACNDAGGPTPFDPPTGASCGDAIALTPGVALPNQSTPRLGVTSRVCRPSDASQRFYTFLLPPGQRAILTVTPTGPTLWNAVVRVFESCTESGCLTDTQSEAPGAVVTLPVDSSGDRARTKVVTVSSTEFRGGERFTIALRLEPLAPPTDGATCATAIPLEPGIAVPGQSVAPGGAPFAVCPAGATPQRYYALTVPAGRRGVVRVQREGDAGIRPLLRLLDGCAATTCLDEDQYGHGVGLGSAVGYDNHGAAPRTVIVSVADPRAMSVPADTYTVVGELAPVPSEPPANVTCAAAAPLPTSPDVLAEVVGTVAEPARVCEGGVTERGRVRYYSAVVPPRTTLAVSALGSDALVRLRESCAASACLGEFAGHEDLSSARLAYDNTGDTPRSVVVEVGARNVAAGSGTRVSASYVPAPSNVTCAGAARLENPASVTGTTAFGTSSAAPCLPAAVGPVAYYVVAVPPGHVLTASAPGAVLRLHEGCGATACLASAADGQIRYRNAAVTSQDLVLEVGAASAADAGPFTLSTRVVGVAQVAASDTHACARMTDGTVACWGGNELGQLGDGTTTDRAAAATVVALSDVEDVAVSRGQSCARVTDGRLLCWGASVGARSAFQPGEESCRGPAGSAGGFRCRTRPAWVAAVPGLVAQVALGHAHRCALLADATTWCWGANDFGQLGDGTMVTRESPTRVTALAGVAQLTLGAQHSCARGVDGTVRCWGGNLRGEVGVAVDDVCSGYECQRTPKVVTGLAGVETMAAGWSHTCAVIPAGVACWGASGGLGLGFVPRDTCDQGTCQRLPRVIPGVTEAVMELALGAGHTCVRTGDGLARCWGDNGFGQLGDGTTAPRVEAAPVTGLPRVAALSAGGDTTCALGVDGVVQCWGSNRSGALGVMPAGEVCAGEPCRSSPAPIVF